MENNAGLTNGKKAWAIFKWSVRKNLSFSIAYWILLFLSFPMVEIFGIIVCNSQKASFKAYVTDMKEVIYYLPATFFAGIAILFSIIMAIMAFSYMHNKRSVDLFGSYPVSRRTLFFVRYLAVLAVCIVPVIVFGMIGAMLAFSNVAIIQTIKILGMLMIAIIGNVSFIAFISLCCGTVADVLIAYLVISVIYPICVAIGSFFPASVLPGLTAGNLPATVFTLLTPGAAFFTNHFGSGKVIGIVWWIALSAVLMVACYGLCKKRKAETAQNAFAFNAVEIVIKFFTCFAAGFGIGYMCSYLGEQSVKEQYIWFAVGAVIAIMTANILLHLVFHRGLSGYRSSLVECSAVFVCLIAFLLIVTSGGLGYVDRIPDENDIQEICIKEGYDNSFKVGGKDLLEKFTDEKEIINETHQIHQYIVSGLKKHRGFLPIIANYDYNYDYETDIKIVYKLKNGKTIVRAYTGNDTYPNIKEIKEVLNKIKQTDYYSTGINPFALVPDKYIESMEISLRTVDTSEDYYDDEFDYQMAESIAEQSIEYIYTGDEKQKAKDLINALRKDVKKYGMYVPKNEETCYSISLYYAKYSQNDYDSDENVSVLLYIPETYHNTMKLMKEYGYYNLAYYYLKDYGSYFDYVEDDQIKVYQTDDVVYFKVPDSWDKNTDIQCMVYDKDENMLFGLDNKISKCTKISENVWSYKIPDTDKYSKEYYDEYDEEAFQMKYLMFYQHGLEKTNLTGLIQLPKEYNGKVLTLGKQTETDYMEFDKPMYEYDWSKFSR